MQREQRTVRRATGCVGAVALVALALLACKKKKRPPPPIAAPPIAAAPVVKTPAPAAVPTASAEAGTEPGSFGALAWSASTSSWYVSIRYPTKAAAKKAALAGCYMTDCTVRAVFHHGQCIAIATGRHGAAGWSWRSSGNRARSHALTQCQKRGTECRIQTTFCNAGADPGGAVSSSATPGQAAAHN